MTPGVFLDDVKDPQPETFPQTVYVHREHDICDNSSYLLVAENLNQIDDDTVTVAVYELKETKLLTIRRELV